MNFQDNPFQKNFELWQQFNDAAMENLFTTFEKNLTQSKALQDQVQVAVSQVVNSQFELVLAGLKAVEGQLAGLSKTLNEVMAAQPK
ncbi:MAG: hypothetical protein L0332_18205 [Chloroflexi bacterium]|nr:hypothetical protein [Chloroflexota bacterium]MCI0575141.1 hypothetical protein [Chloroflexota bacterium]MCI0646290.1 hypothetical protein [Chloroflexota bacterium]MCI0728635.1 hypothetical protein [Chloroflexota bacterium]